MLRRLLLSLAVLPLAAQGAAPAEALTAHLRATALVHGSFTQTRTLAALSRPLVSRGDLVVDQARGVLWMVHKPLTLTFVMGPAGIREVSSTGQGKAPASEEAPMVAQMGRIVKSLLKGRWDAVEDYFTVKGQGTPAKWEVLLDPRPVAAGYIKRVKVQGGAFLERIQVEEPSGDRMELTFQNLRTDLPLSAAEARLFGN
jgi:hypothetical protein